MHKNQEQMHLPYALISANIASMQKSDPRRVLWHLITSHGLSPTHVARKSGVPQSTLSRILSGKIESPSDRQISRLADFFGITGDQIRGRAPLPPEKSGDVKVDIDDFLRPREELIAPEREPRERSQIKSKPKEDMAFINTEIIEDNEPLNPEEVWLPLFREVEFSAGDGSTQVIENHGARERFNMARLIRAGVNPNEAALAIAKGDSMAPTIHDGATLGIDKSIHYVIDSKIYALDHDGMLRVKRLYRLPLNRIRVVSDNSVEYPEEVYSLSDPDAPRIIGKIFWWENFD